MTKTLNILLTNQKTEKNLLSMVLFLKLLNIHLVITVNSR